MYPDQRFACNFTRCYERKVFDLIKATPEGIDPKRAISMWGWQISHRDKLQLCLVPLSIADQGAYRYSWKIVSIDESRDDLLLEFQQKRLGIKTRQSGEIDGSLGKTLML
jgi:hypothetical protein